MVSNRQIGVFVKPPFHVHNAFGLSMEAAQQLSFGLCEMLCPDNRNAEAAHGILSALCTAGIRLQALHAEFPDTTYDTVCKAIDGNGLVPEVRREERISTLLDTARFAQKINAGWVSIHPGNVTWQTFRIMVPVLCDVSERVFDEYGLRLAFESGPMMQHVEVALLKELEDKGHAPRVSLDPANKVLYGVCATPAEGIAYCHAIFDAVPAKQVSLHAKAACYGQTDILSTWLGRREVELASSDSDVDLPGTLTIFDERDCPAAVIIEREINGNTDEKKAAVMEGRDYVLSLMNQ